MVFKGGRFIVKNDVHGMQWDICLRLNIQKKKLRREKHSDFNSLTIYIKFIFGNVWFKPIKIRVLSFKLNILYANVIYYICI